MVSPVRGARVYRLRVTTDVPERAASIRSVFAVGEFRALWLAHGQSRAGDELGRVALAVLVYSQTSSTLLTALTYAMSFLPPLVSAPLLAGLADRHPRRSVLVATDLIRAALFGLMAIPALPVPAIGVLLVAALAVHPLHSAARNAMMPNVLPGDRYVVGFGVISITDGLAQLIGFGLGGVLVGLIGPHTSLGVDALTFAASALLVRFGMRAHRPLPEAGAGSDTAPAPPSRPGGATTIIRDPRLLSLTGLIWLYGFYIAPEGLAAPYAHQLGAGTVAVGLLMAADPLGAALGTYVFTRLLSPAARPRIVGALAVLAGIPLVLSAVHPLLPITFLLWTVSGFLSSHTVLAQAMFVQLVPDHRRGRAVGMLTAGLQTVQGLGVILAGAVAELFEPSVTVALCGVAGATCAVLAALAWHRARTRTRTAMRD